MDLKGKVILVTGGAQGIGAATCQRLAAEGAEVIIVDIAEAKGLALLQDLKDQGARAHFLPANIGKEDDIQKLVAYVEEEIGHLDGIVHCAFQFTIKGIDATFHEWQQTLVVNIIGFASLVKHLLPALRRSSAASIVNVASISGMIAQRGYLTYSTCKAAAIHMSRCLALDFAPWNIRVNSISPATVWTDNNAFHIGQEYGVDRKQADAHPEVGGLHPLGRLADPSEIASAIAFLLSSDANFITGSNLIVDGGYTIK